MKEKYLNNEQQTIMIFIAKTIEQSHVLYFLLYETIGVVKILKEITNNKKMQIMYIDDKMSSEINWRMAEIRNFNILWNKLKLNLYKKRAKMFSNLVRTVSKIRSAINSLEMLENFGKEC